MRFLVVLLGVALAAAGPHYSVDTRDGCPPEGYTALSPNSRLDRLPSGGKYAICRTSAQTVTTTDATWTMSHGVFRLRNSNVYVDTNLQVEFEYPAHPDWSDVVVDGDNWDGVTIRGAPAEEQLTAAYHPHWPAPFGDCGDFDTVLFDNTAARATALSLDYCRQQTTLKKVTIFVKEGGTGLEIEDSKEIVVKNIFIAGSDETNMDVGPIMGGPTSGVSRRAQRRNGGSYFEAASISNSQIGFIAPVFYGGSSSSSQLLELDEGSSVTLCNPFMTRQLSINTRGFIVVDGTASRSSLAVAGITNLVFPNSAEYQGDALVIILPSCPAVLSDAYDPQTWTTYYTTREVHAG